MYRRIITVGILIIIAMMPHRAIASELRLESSRVTVREGDEIVVTAMLSTDEPVNAIEGGIHFSPDAFSVVGIRDGQSVISLWVERPSQRENGIVSFSGITPGGLTGVNNQLFSIILRASQTGTNTVSVANVRALRNDGMGTRERLALRNVVIMVLPGGGTQQVSLDDTEPPEPFTAVAGRDDSLFKGRQFLAFATSDKGSGVAFYAVREGRWGWYRRAESPYRIRYQLLSRTVYIKAVDHAGNERITVWRDETYRGWWEQYGLFAILSIVIVGIAVYIKRWRKRM